MNNEQGFTLVEVLFAVFIVTMGLVGLLSVIPLASYAVSDGYRLSTATFLADQGLEEVRHMPWTTVPDNDCLGVSVNSAAPTVPAGKTCTLGTTTVNATVALPWFADEGPPTTNLIPGFTGYSRIVRITDCGTTACSGITNSELRRVDVTVTYRAGSAVAVSSTNRPVTVSMMVSRR
jgi:prepilin-type N-terminal cleavage/methylation domain-containing protein